MIVLSSSTMVPSLSSRGSSYLTPRVDWSALSEHRASEVKFFGLRMRTLFSLVPRLPPPTGAWGRGYTLLFSPKIRTTSPKSLRVGDYSSKYTHNRTNPSLWQPCLGGNASNRLLESASLDTEQLGYMIKSMLPYIRGNFGGC